MAFAIKNNNMYFKQIVDHSSTRLVGTHVRKSWID